MSVGLIAEFCQNHNGNRETLKKMIYAAASARFTHGKIQGLYSSELTKRAEFESRDSAIYRPFESELARLRNLDLSESDEHWFVKECIGAGITPMITIFSHHGVDRAQKAGFKSIKIASYDCGSLPLINRAASFAEEIVVSTGATSWEEIRETAFLLRSFQELGLKVALLHARTIYPTRSDETGLARMIALREFNLPVGFSDHSRPDTDGLLATKFALVLGAQLVERHFTVLEKSQTKDGPVSINELEAEEISKFSSMDVSGQLRNLGSQVTRLSEFFQIGSLQPTSIELRNANYYRGRVASTIDGRQYFSWEEIE